MYLKLVYDDKRGSFSVRQDGHLFVLGKKHLAEIANVGRYTQTGIDGEFMIVRQLGKHPTGWIVAPVDPHKHILVQHSGFQCHGSMCCTDANVERVLVADDALEVEWLRRATITPGLVMGIVRTTDNVNHNWSRPIYDAEELHRVEQDMVAGKYPKGTLRKHEVAAGLGVSPLAYFKPGWVSPVPGQCYVSRGDTRACGVPSLSDLR